MSEKESKKRNHGRKRECTDGRLCTAPMARPKEARSTSRMAASTAVEPAMGCGRRGGAAVSGDAGEGFWLVPGFQMCEARPVVGALASWLGLVASRDDSACRAVATKQFFFPSGSIDYLF